MELTVTWSWKKPWMKVQRTYRPIEGIDTPIIMMTDHCLIFTAILIVTTMITLV